MKQTLIHSAVCLVLGFIAGAWLFYRAPESPEVVEVLHIDTVRVYTPVEVVTLREVLRIDTVFVAIADTVRGPQYSDSIAVPLPIERKVYADSLYRAVVSGYHPRLDSLTLYQRERVVCVPTATSCSRRWGFGVGAQLGYGVTPKGALPYCGVGVHFGYKF